MRSCNTGCRPSIDQVAGFGAHLLLSRTCRNCCRGAADNPGLHYKINPPVLLADLWFKLNLSFVLDGVYLLYWLSIELTMHIWQFCPEMLQTCLRSITEMWWMINHSGTFERANLWWFEALATKRKIFALVLKVRIHVHSRRRSASPFFP